MANLPRVLCANCNGPMKPIENGVVLEVRVVPDRPYCKVSTDVWGCDACQNMVYIGFGRAVEPWEEAYRVMEPDRVARL